MYIPVGWGIDTTKITKGIEDIKYNNKEHFEKIEKSIKENSKTITIPFNEYEKIIKRNEELEKEIHIVNEENNRLVDEYINFARNNGVNIDIEEGTTFDKDYTEIKIESIRIPEFTIMKIKR